MVVVQFCGFKLQKVTIRFSSALCMQILADLEPIVKVAFVMLELGRELEEAKRPTKTKFGHIPKFFDLLVTKESTNSPRNWSLDNVLTSWILMPGKKWSPWASYKENKDWEKFGKLEFSLSADWALQNGWNEETDWFRDLLRDLLLHVPLQTSDLLCL
jgi:hypothetical protein